MRRSEIFDAFVKIAQEKGMISNDSSDSKKKLEQTGRADSLDAAAIAALYGVKPDAPKGSEYKKNIMEAAHPNSVVVSPSHDKLNGLVENNNERQNILLHIVQKTPDGLLTQRKYAEQDFLLSLVKVANDLDQKNEDDLRKLADFCLEQAAQDQKPIEKRAWVLIAAAVAAVLVGVYLKQHLPFINDGFQKNSEKLIAEIDDLIEANSSTQTAVGAGYKYKQSFVTEMENFKARVQQFAEIGQSVMPIIEQQDHPKDGKELLELSKQPESQAAKAAYDKFKAAYENFLPYIKEILKNFDSEDYKLRQIEEKGILSKIVDAPQILHGGKGLIADDFDDVRHALATYRASLVEIAKILRDANSLHQKASAELQQASAQSKAEMPDLDPNAPSGGAPSGQSPAQQTDQQADGLLDKLKNLGFGGK